jgi:hypothetical protein
MVEMQVCAEDMSHVFETQACRAKIIEPGLPPWPILADL